MHNIPNLTNKPVHIKGIVKTSMHDNYVIVGGCTSGKVSGL